MGFSYCVLFITALVFASTGSSSAPVKKNLTLSDAQSGANELNTVINRRATDEKEERIIGFSSTFFSRFFRAHIEADELPRQAFAKLFSDVSDWTKFTKSTEAAEAFFTGRKFKEWEEHTSRFDQDNLYPNIFSVLKNKLGETEVAKLLSLAMKSESSEEIATKLEAVQFQTWIKLENPREIRTPASIVSGNLNVKIQDLMQPQLEWAKDIVKRYRTINRYRLTKSEYIMLARADAAASGPLCFSAAPSPTSSISSTSSIDALLSLEDPTFLLPLSQNTANRVIFSRNVIQVPLKEPTTNEVVNLVLSQLEFDVMAVHVPQYEKLSAETLLERITQLLNEKETTKKRQDGSSRSAVLVEDPTVSDSLGSASSLAAFQSRVLELEFEKKRLQTKLNDSKARQVHLTQENAALKGQVEQIEHHRADVNMLLQENEVLRFQQVQLGENVVQWKNLAGQTLDKLKALHHELEMVKQQMEDDRDEMMLSVEDAMAMVIDDVQRREQVLQSSYLAEKKEREAMAEKFYEVSGRIRVFCRVRPGKLRGENTHSSALVIPRPNHLLVPHSKKQFAFDQVFGPQSTQAEVYAQIEPLIMSFMDGYNACIMAYGQTGAGKTFTMVGSNEGGPMETHTDTPVVHSNAGVIPRALDHVFAVVKKRQITYIDTLKLSMVEIYNDQILDLLHEGSAGGGKNTVAKNEMDITARDVESFDQVNRVLRDGNANRNIAATKMNLESSRSHALFFLYLTSQHRTTREMRKSTLCLVDLAGSERIARSQVEGDRLRETQHINKSLAALGDVVYALQHKAKHTPYRNSKLTYLLRDMLSGQAKTLLMLQVSPDQSDTEETACSLQFGARVSQVQMGAVRPSVESGQLFKLQEENCAVTAKTMALESQLSDLQLQYQQQGEELSKALGERHRRAKESSMALDHDSTLLSRPRSPLKSSRSVLSSSSSSRGAPLSAPSSLSRRAQVPSSTRVLGASLVSMQKAPLTRPVSRLERPPSIIMDREERQDEMRAGDKIVDLTTARRKSLSAISANNTVQDGNRRNTLSALPPHSLHVVSSESLASRTRQQTDLPTTLSSARQSSPARQLTKPRSTVGVARPASSSSSIPATGSKSTTRTLHRTASTLSGTSTRAHEYAKDRSRDRLHRLDHQAPSSTPSNFLRRSIDSRRSSDKRKENGEVL